jgi:hypothetical protein
MSSENYRQLLNSDRESLEMTPEDFDNTLMHFAELFHAEQMKKKNIECDKEGEQ